VLNRGIRGNVEKLISHGVLSDEAQRLGTMSFEHHFVSPVHPAAATAAACLLSVI